MHVCLSCQIIFSFHIIYIISREARTGSRGTVIEKQKIISKEIFKRKTLTDYRNKMKIKMKGKWIGLEDDKQSKVDSN